jgi:hypothetical protein
MRKSSRYNRAAVLIAIHVDLDEQMVTEEPRSTIALSYPRLLNMVRLGADFARSRIAELSITKHSQTLFGIRDACPINSSRTVERSPTVANARLP